MYQEFSLIYDKLMEDFPYDNYIESLESLLRPRGKILEVGSGSGRMTSYFFQSGGHIHGLDNSLAMLSLAKRRLPGVQFYHGRLEDLSLGDFDQIYACVDILNYYTSAQELLDFLLAVRKHLKGEFFFDLRHPRAMEEDLADQIYFYEEDQADLVWINDRERELIYQDLVIYWKEGQSYRKTSESHVQRIWQVGELEELLSRAGFEIKEKKEEKDRIFYLCGLTEGFSG